MKIPSIHQLRDAYAGHDADGDLMWTIHVSRVEQLLKDYYNLGKGELCITFFDVLDELSKHIPDMGINRNGFGLVVELNTGMKSEAYLSEVAEYFRISNRYGEFTDISKVQSMDQIMYGICEFVFGCMLGRLQYTDEWKNLLTKYGLWD